MNKSFKCVITTLTLLLFVTGCKYEEKCKSSIDNLFAPDGKLEKLAYMGSTQDGSIEVCDEWSVCSTAKMLDSKFYEKGYTIGSCVVFNVKRTYYNSGNSKVHALKYVGDC